MFKKSSISIREGGKLKNAFSIILEISIYSCINCGCVCHSIASFCFIIFTFACNRKHLHRLFYDGTLNFIFLLRQKEIFMGFLSGLFHYRDKLTNSTNDSAYRFLFGGSNSGKAVNKRSAMQMTAVYACVRSLSKSIPEFYSF